MSMYTEKVFKALNAAMTENNADEMSEEEFQRFVSDFMAKQNAAPPKTVTEKNAKTAEDYLELAADADSYAKALEYARKAKKLDPNNIDALRMVVELTVDRPVDAVKKLEQVVAKGTRIMEAQGYIPDGVGEFWGLFETRPYMRARFALMEACVLCGMFEKAETECREILRLCESDNLGARYYLMHIFALQGNEEDALELWNKYDNYDETQFLLPLSILAYRRNDLKKAEEYLKRLYKVNKDAKKFILKLSRNDYPDPDEISLDGYRPFSEEELLVEYAENTMLFFVSANYFIWAAGVK